MRKIETEQRARQRDSQNCVGPGLDGGEDFLVLDMLSRTHSKRELQVGDIMPTFLRVGEATDRPQYSHNMLFANRGDGTYAEVSWYGGVQASEWAWTPIFLDVDLDGYEDLLVTTGHELEMMNADVSNRQQAFGSSGNCVGNLTEPQATALEEDSGSEALEAAESAGRQLDRPDLRIASSTARA